MALKIGPDRRYHWIEEGTDEDFLRNVMECDELPYLLTCFAGSGYTTTRTVYTGSPMWRAVQMAQHHEVYMLDLDRVERTLIQRLLNRPEMQGCEAKNVPQIA